VHFLHAFRFHMKYGHKVSPSRFINAYEIISQMKWFFLPRCLCTTGQGGGWAWNNKQHRIPSALLRNNPSVNSHCGPIHWSEGVALQIVKTQFLQLSEHYSSRNSDCACHPFPALVSSPRATWPTSVRLGFHLELRRHRSPNTLLQSTSGRSPTSIDWNNGSIKKFLSCRQPIRKSHFTRNITTATSQSLFRQVHWTVH
jgi:hypothetical protein